jgi:large subunit ribosomal protein L5|uniref:Ribosomal protein L5 n=1 Tax=Phaeodactylum tricornutum TaxID=2850 RepID=A0A6G7IVM9_PHATR|nr:ribosomal protein L5 [Phaeodactylum tricornutum]
MYFLKHFYIKTLKQELINKFSYKHTKQLPELKRITLNFGLEANEMKGLAISVLALELIAKQKVCLTNTRGPNIRLKTRKGHPAGCKTTLSKKAMFPFFIKTLVEILPKIKNFTGFKITFEMEKSVLSFQIKDVFSFTELERQYNLFNSISKLDVAFVTNSVDRKETIFILKSLQLQLKEQIKQI